MWSLIMFLVVGFFAGLVARALVSGPGPSGLVRTTVLGVIGSFVGGFLGNILFGYDPAEGAFQASGFIGSLIGAVLVLMVYKRTLAR